MKVDEAKQDPFKVAQDLKLGQGFTFDIQLDLQCFYQWLQVVEWPNQSSNLNPTKNPWEDLKRAVHRESLSNLTGKGLFYKE